MRTGIENTQHHPDVSTFFKSSSEEKRRVLSSCGIVLGAEHIATVTADGNRAVINGLINPFNGKKIEGYFSNEEICLTEGDKVAVKLQVMTVKKGQKGLKPTPESIFVLEYICRFDENSDMKIKRLSSRIEEYKNTINHKDSVIAQLRGQSEGYRRKVDDSYKKELESKVDAITKKNEALDSAMKDLAREHRKQLEEAQRTAGIIIDRGITTLVHVTHIDNLESILEKGIIPRAEVPEGAVTIDPTRSEGKRNCNCLSIERPNNKYFSSHANEFGGRSKFVCICIKPTILLDEITKHYCPYNAAINTVSNKIYWEQLSTSESFQGMFADHINEWGPYAGTIDKYRDQEEPLYLPTDVQAEILYEGIINPENIVSIDFPSESALDAAQDMLNKYDIKGTINKRLNF